MSDYIRKTISKKNPYYVEKYRLMELRYFCRQYPIWKKALYSLDGLSKRPTDLALFSKEHSDPTVRCAIARENYKTMIDMVEDCASRTDEELKDYILAGVTEGLSFETLKLRFDIPCGREKYYKTLRKFFWILNNARKIHPLLCNQTLIK